LLRIAGNVASEWRERARVSKPHEQAWLDDLLIESEQEPENSVCQAHTDASVQAAVDKLPPRQRQVLMLRVNEGLTYKQIAERLFSFKHLRLKILVISIQMIYFETNFTKLKFGWIYLYLLNQDHNISTFKALNSFII
jgi:hypothetical protein